MGGVCVLVELWDLHGDSSWQLPLLPCVPSTASMCPSALCHPRGAAGESLVSPGRAVRNVGKLTEIPAFNSVTIPSAGETRRGARFRPQMHPLGSLSAWHFVCVSLSPVCGVPWGLRAGRSVPTCTHRNAPRSCSRLGSGLGMG